MQLVHVSYSVINANGSYVTTDWVTSQVYNLLFPIIDFTVLENREVSDMAANTENADHCARLIKDSPKNYIKPVNGVKCYDIRRHFYPVWWLNSEHIVSKAQMNERIRQMDRWVRSQPKWSSQNSCSSLFKKII